MRRGPNRTRPILPVIQVTPNRHFFPQPCSQSSLDPWRQCRSPVAAERKRVSGISVQPRISRQDVSTVSGRTHLIYTPDTRLGQPAWLHGRTVARPPRARLISAKLIHDNSISSQAHANRDFPLGRSGPQIGCFPSAKRTLWDRADDRIACAG